MAGERRRNNAPPQLLALLWHHCTFYKRHWIQLIITLVLPFPLLGCLHWLIKANPANAFSLKQQPACWKPTLSSLSGGPLAALVSDMCNPSRSTLCSPDFSDYSEKTALAQGLEFTGTKRFCEFKLLSQSWSTVNSAKADDAECVRNGYCKSAATQRQGGDSYGAEDRLGCVLLLHNIAFFPNTSEIANQVMDAVEKALLGFERFYNATPSTTASPSFFGSVLSTAQKLKGCVGPHSEPRSRILGFHSEKDVLAYTDREAQQSGRETGDIRVGEGSLVPNLWGVVHFQDAGTDDVRYNLIYDTQASFKLGRQLMWLQDLLDDAIIDLKTGGGEARVGWGAREENRPCSSQPPAYLYSLLVWILPLFVVTAFMLPHINFMTQVLTEKELKLREYLYIMGVSSLQLKASWIIFYQIWLIPLSFALSFMIIYFPGSVFSNLNYGVLVVTLLLYNFSMSAFCIFLAAFLQSPRRTTLMLVFKKLVAWIIGAATFNSLQIIGSSYILANTLCLLTPVVPLFISLVYMIKWDSAWVGAQGWNLFHSPESLDRYGGIGIAWIWFLASSAIWLLLAWYLEHVFPGEFGVRQPFYFPFMPSFWFPEKFSSTYQEVLSESSADVEKPSLNAVAGIDIRDMSKHYTRDKIGIRNLSLTFYKEEVTAFLGQNGAGKSTTMNILVGLLSPTSGEAKVLGMDIKNDMENIRKQIGFVPQYDILYPSMTVAEHLQFFGWMKGLSRAETNSWTRPLLDKLGMGHLLDNVTTTLSGGQKRKLSVLTAYIGNPKVVILDEPTSGVDPFSRRAIWEMVLAKRREATTLISTHFMEEADLLGERIAIISSGELVASGTPMYLKNRYGKGFRIIVACRPGDDAAAPRAIKEFFADKMPESRLLQEKGRDLSFSFPSQVARAPAMGNFLAQLEGASSELGVASYGLAEPTLEEVFFKSTEMASKSPLLEPIHTGNDFELMENGADGEGGGDFTSDQIRYTKRTNSLPHLGSQIWAMVVKKALFTVFSPAAWVLQIVLPVIFILLLILTGDSITAATRKPESRVDIWESFRTNLVFFQSKGADLDPYIQLAATRGFPPKCSAEDECSGGDAPPGNMLTDPAKAFFDAKRKCNNATRTGSRTVGTKASLDQPHYSTPSGDVAYRIGSESSLRAWVVAANATSQTVAGGLQASALDAARWNAFLATARAKTGAEGADWIRIIEQTTPLAAVTAWHAPNLRLGVANAVANMRLGVSKKGSKSTIYMSTEMKPLITGGMSRLVTDMVGTFFSTIFIACCFAFGTFGIAVLIQEETSTGLKRMQMLLGCNPLVYWGVNFVGDFVLFLATVAVCLFLLGVTDNPYQPFIGDVASIVIPFGFEAIGFTYLLSFLFRGSRGIVIFTIVSFVVFLLVGIVVSTSATVHLICENIGKLGLNQGSGPPKMDCSVISWAPIANAFLRFIPTYFIVDGLTVLVITKLLGKLIMEQFDPKQMEMVAGMDMNPLDTIMGKFESFDVVGKRVLTAIVCGLVYCLIVILLEYFDVRISLCCCTRTQTPQAANPLAVMDNDVLTESQRVLSQPELEEPLIIRQVSKTYGSSKIPAVSDVTVAIPESQCFGLLGINGAGKSTLFKMLTGNLAPTSGSATLGGRDLFGSRGWGRLQGSSYCPQENTLFDALTVRQHLDMFARLRGIPGDARRRVTDCLIQETGLTTHVAKRASQLSGGNQRKLQFAIALLDYSKVIFLDEPTTGMDPGARRSSWAAIRRAISRGSAIVLTSHSMEECEALCDRLVIMVAGSFQCLGSVQYLKGKFGNQYNFKIKLGTSTDPDRVKAAIAEDFPEAKLSEEHATMLHYEIGAESLVLSSLFGRLSSLRSEEGVEDFTVNQTNLEHVFVKMAAVQEMIQSGLRPPPIAAPVPTTEHV